MVYCDTLTCSNLFHDQQHKTCTPCRHLAAVCKIISFLWRRRLTLPALCKGGLSFEEKKHLASIEEKLSFYHEELAFVTSKEAMLKLLEDSFSIPTDYPPLHKLENLFQLKVLFLLIVSYATYFMLTGEVFTDSEPFSVDLAAIFGDDCSIVTDF